MGSAGPAGRPGRGVAPLPLRVVAEAVDEAAEDAALVGQRLTGRRAFFAFLADGLVVEQEAFTAAARTEDAARGIQSFHEHGPGKATFVGR